MFEAKMLPQEKCPSGRVIENLRSVIARIIDIDDSNLSSKDREGNY